MSNKTITTEEISQLFSRLTERDHAIIDALGTHKILTTAMVTAIFFPTRRTAYARLKILTDLGVIHHFRQGRQCTYRYVLSWVGWHIYALRHDDNPPTRATAEQAVRKIMFSSHRAHREGVNGFFAALHHNCVQDDGVTLIEWLNESQASSQCLPTLRPDGAGTLRWDDGAELRFWFEHDMGTESLTTLCEKIDRYRTGRVSGPRGERMVLFNLPSAARVRHFMDKLNTTLGPADNHQSDDLASDNLHRGNPALGNLRIAVTSVDAIGPISLSIVPTDLINESIWTVPGYEQMVNLRDIVRMANSGC